MRVGRPPQWQRYSEGGGEDQKKKVTENLSDGRGMGNNLCSRGQKLEYSPVRKDVKKEADPLHFQLIFYRFSETGTNRHRLIGRKKA